MHRTIAKENTHLGTKFEFMSVILAKTRPACTTKNTEKLIIRLDLEKTLDGSVLTKHWCRHAIDKITCCKKSLIPIPQWGRGMGEQG
jgi:hypothetical protein